MPQNEETITLYLKMSSKSATQIRPNFLANSLEPDQAQQNVGLKLWIQTV